MTANGFRSQLNAGETAGWQETHHYRNETLIDNWNEERFDKQWLSKPQCLPSDASYYYSTTYQGSYNSKSRPCKQSNPEITPIERVPRAFPHHQRELDVPGMKKQTDLFQSEHRTEYIDPKLRSMPLSIQKQA